MKRRDTLRQTLRYRMATIVTCACYKRIPAALEYLKIVVIISTTPDSYAPSIKRLASLHKRHFYLVREIAEIGSGGKTCTTIMRLINHVISAIYELAGISSSAIIKYLPLLSMAVVVQRVIQRQRSTIRRIRIRARGNRRCGRIL